jgi:hypothetical protein
MATGQYDGSDEQETAMLTGLGNLARFNKSQIEPSTRGGSGIRTHEARRPTVFKTVAFVRSAIPPARRR